MVILTEWDIIEGKAVKRMGETLSERVREGNQEWMEEKRNKI